MLQQNKVNYLLCGGLAVNIYGIPRMTADIDLLLEFTDDNIMNFENAMKVLNYQNMIPIHLSQLVLKEERMKLVSEKNLIAYSYFNKDVGHMNLDVLLDTPFSFDQLWKNRAQKELNETSVNLTGIEDLIEMKKYSNRIQDKNDVILLSKLLK